MEKPPEWKAGEQGESPAVMCSSLD